MNERIGLLRQGCGIEREGGKQRQGKEEKGNGKMRNRKGKEEEQDLEALPRQRCERDKEWKEERRSREWRETEKKEQDLEALPRQGCAPDSRPEGPTRFGPVGIHVLYTMSRTP